MPQTHARWADRASVPRLSVGSTRPVENHGPLGRRSRIVGRQSDSRLSDAASRPGRSRYAMRTSGSPRVAGATSYRPMALGSCVSRRAHRNRLRTRTTRMQSRCVRWTNRTRVEQNSMSRAASPRILQHFSTLRLFRKAVLRSLDVVRPAWASCPTGYRPIAHLRRRSQQDVIRADRSHRLHRRVRRQPAVRGLDWR